MERRRQSRRDEQLAELAEEFGRDCREGRSPDVEEFACRYPEFADEIRRIFPSLAVLEGAGKAIGVDGVGFSFFGRRGVRDLRAESLAGVRTGQVLGDFEIIAPIGQGGMGQVWEAEQVSLNRRVALKLVRPDRINQHTLDLFAREARAGGRLHHPGIVTVYGHGEAEGVAWIAMELVEGGWTLKDFIAKTSRKGELPEGYYKRVAELVAELADALQAAHEANVIHRDLKPGNVLITPDEHPKVTDFGLAKITDESALSVSGDIAGTYAYMSPEQVTAKRMGMDHRTDVFSLGVVLYEVLVQRRPFEGDTAAQVAEQIVTLDPPEPRSIRSRVPVDLAVITGKCLEKDRERRYQTMSELAADIRRHLANEPILAKPPTARQRAVKWVRRHPTKSVAAGITVAAFGVISNLLLANVKAYQTIGLERTSLATANKELKAERKSLAMANAELKAERTKLALEIKSVKRLRALHDYEDLVAEVHGLWPPYPENVDKFLKWIGEMQELVDELPLHHAKREELRAMAVAQSPEVRRTERENHPDYPRWQALAGVIATKRTALLQRRDGVQAKLPDMDWGSLPQDAAGLCSLAWPLVNPERTVFGREAEGLVLVRRGLQLAQEAMNDDLVADADHTLAHALWEMGRDQEGVEAVREALEVGPERMRENYQKCLSIEEARSEKARSVEGIQDAEEALAQLEAEREELEVRVNERQDWKFPETEDGRTASWWQANLSKLIEALDGLGHPRTGLLSDREGAATVEHGWSVVWRLAFAESLAAGFASGGEFRLRWEKDLPAIREAYPGLELVVQLGLVPIGADPGSRLWEFWDVQSGTEPLRGADGKLVMEEGSGLVFVLLPGGKFWMGAQASDQKQPNYDRQARSDESPVRDVELSPFFLSKYEMTQGQWLRLTSDNPSGYTPETYDRNWNAAGLAGNLLHPVEQVNWRTCTDVLARHGLVLPSEAQWEYGARGGTQSVWWTGDLKETLSAGANVADRYARGHGGPSWGGWEDWDDGNTSHAIVSSFAANLFGLYDVAGNVREWCRDGFDEFAYRSGPLKDPVVDPEFSAYRMNRGGSMTHTAGVARSAYRQNAAPGNASDDLGLRPARAVAE